MSSFPALRSAEVIQELLSHKSLLYVDNMSADDCTFGEYKGDVYVLANREGARKDTNLSFLTLKNVSQNKDIELKSFTFNSIPESHKSYKFHIADFDLNDKYLVISSSIYIYIFHTENDDFKYFKKINLKKSFDKLKLENNILKMASCHIGNGNYTGEYATMDLEDESFSVSSMYRPIMWRFLFFQPRELVDFFQDSYVQSEIIKPVLYFHNESGIDTVNFDCEGWIDLPDSVVAKMDPEFDWSKDKHAKNTIDNLRGYLKQTSLIHKIYTISENEVYVLWSVPDPKKRYEFKHSIIRKDDNGYSIVANNLSNMETDFNKSLSDYNYVFLITSSIIFFDNNLVSLMEFPMELTDRHKNMPLIELVEEAQKEYLKSDKSGLYINIMEFKHD